MSSDVLESTQGEPIWQLSVFADNKVGRLNELLKLLSSQDLHVLALSTQDTTDSTIIRLILDYPNKARSLLKEHGYFHTRCQVIGVEFDDESKLKGITASLLQAEINIYYVYPFIMRPNGKYALVFSLEDIDLATEVLNGNQFKVLNQSDITR